LGDFGLRQLAKCVIQRDFRDVEGSVQTLGVETFSGTRQRPHQSWNAWTAGGSPGPVIADTPKVWTVPPSPADADAHKRALRAILMAHQAPLLGRSLGQMASTFLFFFGLIAAMYWMLDICAWCSLTLAVPAAGLVVRIFIIQHDCGHGAFFRSRAANEWLGRFCSLITMTPYANWRHQHAIHHAVWNNLDRRSAGADIYSTCPTVAEYRTHSALGRWWRRVVRHPLIAHLLLPPLIFVLLYRIPFHRRGTWMRERASVLLTNAGLAVVLTTLSRLLGVGPVALVQLPTIAIASIFGVWIFSVQHRFENAVWSRQEEWSAAGAALFGSSHLKLPRVLQWFSGNIGFHHIHHLMPRVPNYRLEDCHRACADIVSAAPSLTLMQGLRAPTYALWDEEQARMVRFSDLRAPARTA
jgi:acyl-lipid omega-6 desaturase (Delta-12 desaturase)